MSPRTPLQITVQMSDSDVDLNLDEDDYFVLPNFGTTSPKQATLVANRAEGAIVIHPVVRTPADGEGITHLGDLRLECEVSWAIQKGSASLAIRSMFAIGGRVCHSHNIAVDFYAPKKLLSVTIVDGQKTQPLRIGRSCHVYMPPVADESWPDSTLVQYVYVAKR